MLNLDIYKDLKPTRICEVSGNKFTIHDGDDKITFNPDDKYNEIKISLEEGLSKEEKKNKNIKSILRSTTIK